MATASRRKQAIQNMVTILKTVTPGATYFRKLNIAENVSTKVRLMQTAQEGTSFIWVRAGTETLNQGDVSGGTVFESVFEILLDIYVKDESASTMVEELEDLIHDVSLCLGSNRRLSGVVADSIITRVEPPIYGFEDLYAVTTIHVAVVFDFQYGSTT